MRHKKETAWATLTIKIRNNTFNRMNALKKELTWEDMIEIIAWNEALIRSIEKVRHKKEIMLLNRQYYVKRR